MATALHRFVRLLKIGAVLGVAVGVLRALRGRNRPDVTGEARWQPLADTEPAPARPSAAPPTAAPSPKTTRGWVEPVDGACPASHPVKGNAGSKIYHVVGGASYARTIPERCYASAADAEADGFRAAKR